jgi:hypothetical protein
MIILTTAFGGLGRIYVKVLEFLSFHSCQPTEHQRDKHFTLFHLTRGVNGRFFLCEFALGFFEYYVVLTLNI